MPNLTPPVVTTADARAYRERILAALPAGSAFRPLMTAYLTEATDPDDLAAGAAEGVLTAVKLYPAGATTNSASGVTDLCRVLPVLERMERIGLPLLIHGEVVDAGIDIFDREKVFVDTVLAPLVRDFPGLKIVLEHVTTADGAAFVAEGPETLAATVTAHHLLIDRNAMLVGGIRPHHYCLPVPKRARHREALVAFATSGSHRVFLGTDSAPHPRHAKESACGCAGIYTAHAAIELYAEAFDRAGALDRLEAFASLNGPRFYGLEPNPDTITLDRAETPVPEHFDIAGEALVPFRAGGSVGWRVMG
jgi:dihydroorotase